MTTSKLLIAAVVAMATTLVVVTQAQAQAQATELDGKQHGCVRISWLPCVAHLTGKARIERCCDILTALSTEECQCWAMESISNAYKDVDREYAKNLPRECGTLDESCSFKMSMLYM